MGVIGLNLRENSAHRPARNLGAVLLLLFSLLFVAQPVNALPSVSGPDCTYVKAANVVYEQVNGLDALSHNSGTVAGDGSFVFTTIDVDQTAPSNADSSIYRVTPSCSTSWVWTNTAGTTAGDAAEWMFPHYDARGQISLLEYVCGAGAVTTRRYNHLYTQTGQQITGLTPASIASGDFPTIVAPCGAGGNSVSNPTAVSSYRLEDDSMYYVAASACGANECQASTPGEANKLRFYSDDGYESQLLSVGNVASMFWNQDPTNPFLYVASVGTMPAQGAGGTMTLQRVNLLTSALSATLDGDVDSVSCNANGPGRGRFTPLVGYKYNTESLKVIYCNSSGGNTWKASTVNTATWAYSSTATITGMGSYLGSANYAIDSVAMDGDGGMFTCGRHNSSNIWIGYVDTSNAFTSLYDTAVSVPGVTLQGTPIPVGVQCHMDYNTGLWIRFHISCKGDSAAFGDCAVLQHYSMSGATQPNAPSVDADYYPAPSGPTFTGTTTPSNSNPLAVAVNYADNAWGFASGTWGFIMGIVIVAIMAVIFGRVPHGQPIVTAIGGLLGVGLSVLLGLFGVWVLFIIGLLVTAFVASQFFRGNPAEE